MAVRFFIFTMECKKSDTSGLPITSRASHAAIATRNKEMVKNTDSDWPESEGKLLEVGSGIRRRTVSSLF
jgi:hypothetical protein